jgi:hypothetical protein
MRDDKHKREGHVGGSAKKDLRQDRLKLALRENLKRRKSQARARTDAAISPSNDDADHDDASPPTGGETKPRQ